MKRSTVLFSSAAVVLALGIGVLVAKRMPKLSSTTLAAPKATKTAQGAPQQQHFVLKFAKNPEPVPTFNLKSFSGQTLNPAEWRGKVVILNFWATWCGPCRYEIPELMALQKEFPDSLQVVGLSVDEAPPAEVKQFADRMGITYPVAIADDQLQNRFGGVLALPTSFVIDRQGRVVQKHVGLMPQDYYAMEIGYLAGKKVDADVQTFVDEGQIFPSNVKNAKTIPGVDMSKLTPAESKLALRKMNEMHCTCGCGYTVAQCRVLDSACPVSKQIAQKIVDQIAKQGPTPAKPVATSPARPTR
ncbi:MAG: TlpA family protein disulfide reductase [Acidobacteriota bacterium]|nr:TlpA family protein disulfide reductase [Acidobacteriota bacterium]